MNNAAIGSAHHQPSALLATSPSSNAADMYVHSRVCLESATAEWEPSRRIKTSLRRRVGAALSAVSRTEVAAGRLAGLGWVKLRPRAGRSARARASLPSASS